jgi:hypothetical protein
MNAFFCWAEKPAITTSMVPHCQFAAAAPGTRLERDDAVDN